MATQLEEVDYHSSYLLCKYQGQRNMKRQICKLGIIATHCVNLGMHAISLIQIYNSQIKEIVNWPLQWSGGYIHVMQWSIKNISTTKSTN